MIRKVKPARIALGAALAAFTIGWGLALFNTGVILDTRTGGTYEVEAIFDQTPGLTEGAELKAGGEVVGEVSSISLEGEDMLPHVRMSIEESFRLRQGAIADLRLYSNAGQLNRYIALEQGKGDRLAEGDTIGLALTDQPVEFDQVLRTLDRETRKDLSAALDSLNKGTAGRGADFEQIIEHGGEGLGETAELLAQLNADGEALRTTFAESNRIVGAMAEDPAALGNFADELGGLLETTAARQEELAATAERAAIGQREPRLALDRLRASIPNLRGFVRVARPAIAELPATARELRPTLDRARPTLRQASLLTERGPADLRSVAPLLRTTRPLLDPLEHTLCQAGPILDMARASGPDLLAGAQLFGAINRGFDANGHGARIFIHNASITGGEVQPDEDGLGFLVEPLLRVPGTNLDQPWREFRSSFIGGDGECG